MADKNSFVLYTDYSESVDELTDEEAGKLFKALLHYEKVRTVDDLDRVVYTHFSYIKKQLDRDRTKWEEIKEKRIESGKKGGINSGITRSKCLINEANEASASQSKQTEANEAVNVDVNVNGNVDVTVNEKKKEKVITPNGEKPPVKSKYGMYKNVLLSDEDMQKLKVEFPDWNNRIEKLSEYIESKGAKYKSHLATIRAWARKDRETTPYNPTSKIIC